MTPLSDFKVGMSVEALTICTDDSIRSFSESTGDKNPIHLDESFARTTPFKKRIAHGMWTGGLISSLIAGDLPGKGSIYLGQNLTFLRPVYIADEITVTVEIIDMDDRTDVLKLNCKAVNQDGVLVVHGVAEVLAKYI